MDARALFEEAREVAISAHGAQAYGDQPYEVHLRAVVDVLTRFGASLDDPSTASLLIAAWLHDCLEDTPLSRAEVEARFGSRIADLVWRVTNEAGATRSERRQATYGKTREDEAAIVLKLADRIANVEASLKGSSALLRMYQQEHPEFKRALFSESTSERAGRMWSHLDRLLDDDRGGL